MKLVDQRQRNIGNQSKGCSIIHSGWSDRRDRENDRYVGHEISLQRNRESCHDNEYKSTGVLEKNAKRKERWSMSRGGGSG
jgi:hypothetical protein